MGGGIAVRGNLMAVAFSAAKGHVILVDVEARARVTAWRLPDGEAGWSDATGVAMDERYHVFVADAHNDRVLEYAPFGRFVRAFGVPPPEAGDAGRDRPGVLDKPHAVAVRGDLLYVACGEQPRRRGVQRLSRRGTVLRPLACRGDAAAKFGAPRGLWADAEGVVVADTLRGELSEYRGDGAFMRASRTAPAGSARPVGVARDAAGNCWFVADGVVRRLAQAGAALPPPAAVAGEVRDAVAIALDAAGRLYVLDRHGERVLRFGADGAFDGVWFDVATVGAPKS